VPVALDDQRNAPDGADVGHRIAVDQHKVGALAALDAADLA
jgi:hypothetical protein